MLVVSNAQWFWLLEKKVGKYVSYILAHHRKVNIVLSDRKSSIGMEMPIIRKNACNTPFRKALARRDMKPWSHAMDPNDLYIYLSISVWFGILISGWLVLTHMSCMVRGRSPNHLILSMGSWCQLRLVGLIWKSIH